MGESSETFHWPLVVSPNSASSDGRYLLFSPQIFYQGRGSSIYQTGTKLDLDKSDLMNIKEITGKMEIETIQGR